MSGTPAADVLPVYLVKGDDPTLVADALRSLLADVVGDINASLAVEELPADVEASAIVDAAQTPPFFSDRRVVVARDVGRFTTAEVAPLVTFLADPLPSTTVVLVGGGGQTARSLLEAIGKVGHVIDAGAPKGKSRAGWLATKVKGGPVRVTNPGIALIDRHLGDDVGRLGSLLEVLAAAYGEGATVGPDELGPFLGEAGAVAPWELTDAIDKGDTAAALSHLHRLVAGGGRHPLVVLATLHTHYSRMLRLDGSDAGDEKAAARLLSMTGSTFPAKKALVQARRLGHDRIARAIVLLAEADLALKGTTEWPPELVLEVLVARLSRLMPRAQQGSPAGAGGGGRRRG